VEGRARRLSRGDLGDLDLEVSAAVTMLWLSIGERTSSMRSALQMKSMSNGASI